MTVGLIWAQAANGIIGRDNTIPWQLPEDLVHFRELTTGTTVVMGRRTWDSLPARSRPLPQRRNVVLTRDASWSAEGAEARHDVESALADGADADADVWVIGGAQVYLAALPHAHLAVVTELAEEFAGDRSAPPLDASWISIAGEWQESRTGLRYRFVSHTR